MRAKPLYLRKKALFLILTVLLVLSSLSGKHAELAAKEMASEQKGDADIIYKGDLDNKEQGIGEFNTFKTHFGITGKETVTDSFYISRAPLNTINVSHDRQMRGAWVATVYNINWPHSQTDSVNTMKNSLVEMLDQMKKLNMNAVFFQVRPEGDALYKSNLEPWSRYLTGTQGKAPAGGFDPLEFIIKEGHSRGIEVHAWLNPYRASVNANHSFAANHVSKTMASDVVKYNNLLWMDPGSERIMNHTYNVVMDIVTRYDVDGIHFDDYFYPYPSGGLDFPDNKTWDAYKKVGGKLSREDWRRDNVNRLITKVYNGIQKKKPHVRFGISPFGIYRPGIPPGITGLDQYNQLYADPKHWLEKGIVDYLAPQLYWPTTSTGQNYDKLLNWWLSINPLNKDIFVGHYLAQLGKEGWTVNEFRKQLNSIEQRKHKKATGSIMYHIDPLLSNQNGIADTFKKEFWKSYALIPPIPGAIDMPGEPKVLAVKENMVSLSPDNKLKGFAIYKKVNSSWKFMELIQPSKDSIILKDGIYAITSVSRSGLESKGVITAVPYILPEMVSINRDNIKIDTGGVRNKARLRAVFFPENTTNKGVTWESNNPGAAVVNSHGIVTAVGEGTSTITVTTTEGGLRASCIVTVSDDGVLYGDVNYDGVIDTKDAIHLLRHLVGLTSIPEERLPVADVNVDGDVNVTDAIQILRYIVGLFM